MAFVVCPGALVLLKRVPFLIYFFDLFRMQAMENVFAHLFVFICLCSFLTEFYNVRVRPTLVNRRIRVSDFQNFQMEFLCIRRINIFLEYSLSLRDIVS